MSILSRNNSCRVHAGHVTGIDLTASAPGRFEAERITLLSRDMFASRRDGIAPIDMVRQYFGSGFHIHRTNDTAQPHRRMVEKVGLPDFHAHGFEMARRWTAPAAGTRRMAARVYA